MVATGGKKGFRTTSPTHISSVQDHARHKTKYLPRPPGSSVRASVSAPLLHSFLPSVGFNLPCPSFPLTPHLSFEDPVPVSPRSPAHPQLSCSSGVGGSFRNLQRKKFRSAVYELGSDPRTAAGSLSKETPAGFPRADARKPNASSQPGGARAVPETCWRGDLDAESAGASSEEAAAVKLQSGPASAFKSTTPAFQQSSGERPQPIRSPICFRGRVHPGLRAPSLPRPEGVYCARAGRSRGARWEQVGRVSGFFFFFPLRGRDGRDTRSGRLGGTWQELKTCEMGCCGRRVEVSMILSL